LSDPDRSRASRSRALRVSAERVFELARHLTERDRAIALALYEHQLLTEVASPRSGRRRMLSASTHRPPGMADAARR
jgi:hypothetical protein